MADDSVTLELTADEALVLSAWLERVYGSATDQYPLIEDKRELVALWNLLALLERQLVVPFEQDYSEQVQEARVRLRGDTDSK